MNSSTKIILSVALFWSTASIAQPSSIKPNDLVMQVHEKGNLFTPVECFAINREKNLPADLALKTYESLRMNRASLNQIISQKPDALGFIVPFKGKFLEAELVKVNLFTPDFKVETNRSGSEPVLYKPGVYYRGILKGENKSIVTLTFFSDQIIGIISSENYGNIIISRIESARALPEDYIIFSDRELRSPHTTNCSTIENPSYAQKLYHYALTAANTRTANCVRLYYEMDHDLFIASGSDVTSAVNWMTAVHNNVSALFSNDNISTSLSGVYVWMDTDPYHGESAASELVKFQAERPQINGDLGQLVSIEPQNFGGVAANINGFCSTEDKYAYSEVDYEYLEIPAYSWTVDVITHEFGHLMGSYHTHNCSWPGGAIDNCGPLAGYPNEGTCPSGPPPVDGGTIMSYCQLTGYGVNFANGFGPLPANAIRGAVDAASCLTSDCSPIVQEYCPSVGATSGEWIDKVMFNDLSNSSGAGNGYSDFTNIVFNTPTGANTAFSLIPGYSGTNWTEYFSIWIDLNQDMDFFDPGENVFKSSGTKVAVSGTFYVPKFLSGLSRMRIAMMYDALPGPCEIFEYGEVEDYTVNFDVPIEYCSTGGNATQEWIDFVGMGELIRESVSDGGYYYHGSESPFNVIFGSDNVITYSAGMNGGPYPEFWAMWIDYNQDGDFKDDEKVFSRNSLAKKLLTRKFTIPGSALLGTTRLRLSMKRGDSPKFCEDFEYGEVEDYDINILPASFAALELLPVSKVKLYPNPASNFITVILNEKIHDGHFVVMDLSGRIIYEQEIPADQQEIIYDATLLVPGMYMVKILSEGNDVVNEKFIRQ